MDAIVQLHEYIEGGFAAVARDLQREVGGLRHDMNRRFDRVDERFDALERRVGRLERAT